MTNIAQRAPWALGVGAMMSVQLGSALSIGVIHQLGPAGTAWLRLTFGAVFFVALARPPLRSLHRRDIPVIVGLGATTGVQTLAFLAAIERIPLGTSVAIEFLGPLTVAARRSHSLKALAAGPLLALIGVLLLTEPWTGDMDRMGVLCAALAAVGWALYVVLTQRLGDRYEGFSGLSLTVPIASATAAVIGIPQAVGHLTLELLLATAALAVLLPVLPYAVELVALRHMTHLAFGTLMALEPAIGVLLGLVVLSQRPSVLQLAGIAMVVAAGVASQRSGRRVPADRLPVDLDLIP